MMNRNTVTIFAIAALMSAATTFPVMAQQTKPVPPTAAPAPEVERGSDAWLQQRGETYRAAPDSQQDPKEQAETSRLNAGIAAQNAQADQTDADNAARFENETAEWRAERDRIEAENARAAAAYATAVAAAEAENHRRIAAYEAAVAECERAGGRNCRAGK